MKMLRKIFFTACGIIGSSMAFGQQAPLFSQYMFNDYVLNPAIAGIKDYSPVRTVLRSQWTGIEGQPNTQTLSFHTRASRRVGVGGYIFNDKIGPISQTGFSASYAFRFRISNYSRLSLGIGAMGYHYRVRTDEIRFDSQGTSDNVANDGNFQAFYPNFSFGAYYYGKQYYLGVSVPELLQTKITSSNEFFLMRQVRHYYLTGGYKIMLGKDYALEPSTLVKYVAGAPVQLDITANFIAYDQVSIGASYRSNDAVVAFIGFRLQDRYRIGYSYDITMTELRQYTRGSHEIMLGYDLQRKKDKPSI